MANCDQIRDQFLDLAAHDQGAPADVNDHLRSCSACAAQLAALRSTVNVLDAWTAPEPSPYFDQRLMARVREAAAEPQPFWSLWLKPFTGWKPAMALSLFTVLAIGVGVFTAQPPNVVESQNSQPEVSAVNDLDHLDRDEDMLQNFDFTDDNSGSVTAQ